MHSHWIFQATQLLLTNHSELFQQSSAEICLCHRLLVWLKKHLIKFSKSFHSAKQMKTNKVVKHEAESIFWYQIKFWLTGVFLNFGGQRYKPFSPSKLSQQLKLRQCKGTILGYTYLQFWKGIYLLIHLNWASYFIPSAPLKRLKLVVVDEYLLVGIQTLWNLLSIEILNYVHQWTSRLYLMLLNWH